jgi:4-carboxymuconolactone decarboxylase
MPTPPFPDLNSLTVEQQRVYEEISSGPRGKVEGPLLMWLTSPELANSAQRLGQHCRFNTGLSPSLSELAIIVTGAFWKSGFEWHVHAPIAEKHGISPAIIDAIREDRKPDFTDEAERIVYEFSRELWREHRVSEATRHAAIEMFGARTTVELVGILGYYGLISMTINAFEIPTPTGVDPFKSDT